MAAAPCSYSRTCTTRQCSGAVRGVIVSRSRNNRRPSQHLRCIAHAAASSNSMVLFELEGAVIDMHMDGHRVAFNKAFTNLGYECVQWPLHVYHDLLSVGDGTAESMVYNYFNLCGWPTMLATSDQEAFVKKVHASKQAALFEMLASGAVPLRTGVKQVIEDATHDGARVVFITGTASEASDLVVRNALMQLDPQAAAQVQVVSSGAVRQDMRYALRSESGDEDPDGPGNEAGDGAGVDTTGMKVAAARQTMGELLRERQDRQRRQTAQAFVASVKSGNGGEGPMVPLAVDPSLLASARRVSPELLAAVAAAMDVPLARCILLAASNSLTEAAASAGMTAIAVPRKMAERGSFSGARAKFTGFGAGDCTWGRLTHFLKATSNSTA